MIVEVELDSDSYDMLQVIKAHFNVSSDEGGIKLAINRAFFRIFKEEVR